MFESLVNTGSFCIYVFVHARHFVLTTFFHKLLNNQSLWTCFVIFICLKSSSILDHMLYVCHVRDSIGCWFRSVELCLQIEYVGPFWILSNMFQVLSHVWFTFGMFVVFEALLLFDGFRFLIDYKLGNLEHVGFVYDSMDVGLR